MVLNIQLMLFFISFLFGLLYCIFFILYKKYIRNKNYIITDFIYNVTFTLLFTYIIYRVNYLNLNYYILLAFLLGFFIAYLTVNHF